MSVECPYCGGDMEPDTEWVGGIQKFYFLCECHARTPWAPTRDAAIELAICRPTVNPIPLESRA